MVPEAMPSILSRDLVSLSVWAATKTQRAQKNTIAILPSFFMFPPLSALGISTLHGTDFEDCFLESETGHKGQAHSIKI